MNRMMLLLMSFDIKFISDPSYASKEEKKIVRYYIAKSYLTVAESLILLAGFYEATYQDRADRFAQIYKKVYTDIYRDYPNLTNLVYQQTRFKFRPHEDNLDNYLEEWFKCRKIMGVVYRKCTGRLIDKDLSKENYISLYGILEKELSYPYFKLYASRVLKKYHLNSGLLNRLVVKLGQIFLSYKYFLALKRTLGRIYWPAISIKDPGLVILRILPLILYSNDKNNKVDQKMLNLAKKELKKVYPEFKGNDWRSVKKNWLYAYRIYYLQRFI